MNPYDGNVYGVIGDAQLELGRYDDAFATFQTMVDTLPVAVLLRPGVLRARAAGRRRRRDQAMEAAARCRRHARRPGVGQLPARRAVLQQRPVSSERPREYRARRRAPTIRSCRLAGLAKVAWARGDVRPAIDRYAEVVSAVPVTGVRDRARRPVRSRPGATQDAQRQFDLVRAEAQLFAANGVNIDLELALFDADHGDPARARSAAARDEWASGAERPRRRRARVGPARERRRHARPPGYADTRARPRHAQRAVPVPRRA